jgi:hypothetical protein
MDKYNARWPNGTHPLKIERACIRQGGKWVDEDGKECGLGLFHHHREFQKIVWPWKAWHKWNLLTLSEITQNKITAVLGPASCVTGDSLIFDPVTGQNHEIGRLFRRQIAPVVGKIFHASADPIRLFVGPSC